MDIIEIKAYLLLEAFNFTTTTIHTNNALVKKKKRNWKRGNEEDHDYVVLNPHFSRYSLLSVQVLNSGKFQF